MLSAGESLVLADIEGLLQLHPLRATTRLTLGRWKLLIQDTDNE